MMAIAHSTSMPTSSLSKKEQKMKPVKEVKGVFKGVGKQLTRAANSLTDAVKDGIPSQKKGGKLSKSLGRELLMGEESPKPQVRTAAEIKAAYGHSIDTASLASQARQKLSEREEKLSGVQRRTEEMQAGAENFASLADELVKKMESRKWYHV